MWDEKDYAARWIQGICGVFLALFAAADAYFVISNLGLFYLVAGFALFVGSVRLSWRCLRYAVTGRGNVNRDESALFNRCEHGTVCVRAVRKPGVRAKWTSTLDLCLPVDLLRISFLGRAEGVVVSVLCERQA